jgi:hypothetical protein
MFRGGLEVVHGVPVLLGGVENTVHMALLDTFHWLTHLHQVRDITDTRTHYTNILTDFTEGGSPVAPPSAACLSETPAAATATPVAAVCYHLSLPVHYEKKEVAVFEMRHELSSVKNDKKMFFEQGAELLDTLVAELNNKFMCDLGDFSLIEQYEDSELEYDHEVIYRDLGLGPP